MKKIPLHWITLFIDQKISVSDYTKYTLAAHVQQGSFNLGMSVFKNSMRPYPPGNRLANRTAESGFTLLEVMIAFAILSLSLLAIHQTYAGALRSTRSGEATREALEVAQSLLDKTRGSQRVEPHAATGKTGTGAQWHLDISAWGAATQSAARRAQQVFLVDVQVKSIGNGRPVRLRTLMHVPQGIRQ